MELTAIKLLLTEPRPFADVLKCSITSQLDFFGVVVVCGVVEANGDDDNGCTCSSSEICADRVCRSDVERRVRPPPFRETPSYSTDTIIIIIYVIIIFDAATLQFVLMVGE